MVSGRLMPPLPGPLETIRPFEAIRPNSRTVIVNCGNDKGLPMVNC